ncbi:hypothetical protein [Sulfuricurvum sp.]|uniref:hypothetical protein n=1 Tax=Sulfuricurvum sp. TaxID=2025608 RepID=UPI003C483700
MNKKNAQIEKKNAGRPQKKLKDKVDKCFSISGINFSGKDTLTRNEVMIYLDCGHEWLNQQYKEGGLFMQYPKCFYKDKRRVFFLKNEIDKAIKSLAYSKAK